MRFWITTIAVFAVLALSMVLFGQWARTSAISDYRAYLKQLQARGELPPEVDLNVTSFEDFDTEVPDYVMVKISLSDLVTGAAWLWVPIFLIVSLGIAALISRMLRR